LASYTAIAVPVYDSDRVDGSKASSGARPYLEVVAPGTLPEGYAFDVEFDGQSFSVKVPVGGVEEGQKFSVPFPCAADGYSGTAVPYQSGPMGRWKDSMCDCCQLGICHPVIWNAYCCPLILLGQVMTRLKLTWLANDRSSSANPRGTFYAMATITAVLFLLRWIVTVILVQIAPSSENGFQQTNTYLLCQGASYFITIMMIIFIVTVVVKTRKRIRQKYGIPAQDCGGCEDCCCAYWCTCCTIAQMARHTANYETYAAQCCSETGLPQHAPALDTEVPSRVDSIV